jgi:hypothetical protein
MDRGGRRGEGKKGRRKEEEEKKGRRGEEERDEEEVGLGRKNKTLFTFVRYPTMLQLMQSAYPEHSWDQAQFARNQKLSRQKHMSRVIKHLFPGMKREAEKKKSGGRDLSSPSHSQFLFSLQVIKKLFVAKTKLLIRKLLAIFLKR